MRKNIFKILFMALPMLLGLASCVDHDNPVIDKGGGETVVAPDVTQPTEDQMAVTVTENVPTAVLRNLEGGSTGAALVKRLPQTTATITPETRMVLIPGSMFADGTDMTREELDAIVRLSLDGGYLTLERPTGSEMANFALLYVVKLIELQIIDYQDIFGLDPLAAARAAENSQIVKRAKARLANIEQIVRRRSGEGEEGGEEGVINLDDVMAEMISFGPTAYFMQQPHEEEITTYVNTDDDEGPTELEPVTTINQRTNAVSGVLADASAEWLNNTEKNFKKQQAKNRAITRADGSSAINFNMDATEEFTFNEPIDFRDERNDFHHCYNRVNMVIRSWSVYDKDSDKDYYYVRQSVAFKHSTVYADDRLFKPQEERDWYYTSNYGDFKYWYGSFLSQYVTSMKLYCASSYYSDGVKLVAAKPETGENSSPTTVVVNQSGSGYVGCSSGYSDLKDRCKVDYKKNNNTFGIAQGTSFLLSQSQPSPDFQAEKTTNGNKVTWTYKGALPKFKWWFEHSIAPAFLVEDNEVVNEVCWSVDEPYRDCSLEITSQTQTAALMYKNANSYNPPVKYEYTTTETAKYKQELLEPNRFFRGWRMCVTVYSWKGEPKDDAVAKLEADLCKEFSDVYAPKLLVGEESEYDYESMRAVYNYSSRKFGDNYYFLRSLGNRYGISSYSIHWISDDVYWRTDDYVDLAFDVG